MRFYGVLTVLFVAVSTASGLTCYSCLASDAESCKQTINCPYPFDRCFSMDVKGLFTKGCQINFACITGLACCEGDLCNSAIPTEPCVFLLLVSSAIITLFL